MSASLQTHSSARTGRSNDTHAHMAPFTYTTALSRPFQAGYHRFKSRVDAVVVRDHRRANRHPDLDAGEEYASKVTTTPGLVAGSCWNVASYSSPGYAWKDCGSSAKLVLVPCFPAVDAIQCNAMHCNLQVPALPRTAPMYDVPLYGCIVPCSDSIALFVKACCSSGVLPHQHST